MQEFRRLIIELALLFKPETYVEIGVFKGQTFNSMANIVGLAVAVDVRKMELDRYVVDQPNVKKFCMTSDEFAKIWSDPIDLLFIDADHRKEQVLKDFDSLSKYVREGTGLILLHDTYPINEKLLVDTHCSNAWEAAWKIRKNVKYENFEIVTLPGPRAGISIIRKAVKHLAWRG